MNDLPFSRPPRPYPGLRPFEASEWTIFFGRERMIDDVIDRLARQRLVLIHGASGSGKSSLVRAGVLPRLARQHQRHGAAWSTAAMRPSGGPLWNLARMFATLDNRGGDAEHIAAILQRFNVRGASLSGIASEIQSLRGRSLCLLIDQFEELFRFEKETSREEAELFVDLISGAVNAADAPDVAGIHVVVTMRSEFLGECARFDRLADTINQAQYLVPRMDRDALMRAVRRPAQLYNGFIDENLADRLIASVAGRVDELPLLQHGLMLLWLDAEARAAPGERISPNGDVVDKAGGLAALLSGHADTVLAEVAPDDRRMRIASSLFRALTDVNAEGAAIRRPQAFRDLVTIAGDDANAVRDIVDAFRAPDVSFITPYAPAEISDNAIIDISHEALIRCWSQIASAEDGWLKQEFDDGLAWRSLRVEADAHTNDPQHTLPAATTRDLRRRFEHSNEGWSRRYGGGWAAVQKLLAASRAAAAAARQKARFTMAALATLAIGATGLAGGTYVALQKAELATAQANREAERANTASSHASLMSAQAEERRKLAEDAGRKAEQTSRLARLLIDQISDDGRSCPRAVSNPRRLLAIATEFSQDGNAGARYMLGLFHECGLGTDRDVVKARYWYEEAAKDGDDTAMWSIGLLHYNGQGVERSYAKAREWFEKSADKGNVEAVNSLGVLFRNRDYPQWNLTTAHSWHAAAAAREHAGSMNGLGLIYENVDFPGRNLDTAREWYEKAVARGNVDGMNNLGILLQRQDYAKQNLDESRQWLERAAARGNLIAMRNLGSLLLNKRYSGWNIDAARGWYEKAAAENNLDAMIEVGIIFERSDYDKRSLDLAKDWYEKAAAKNSATAMNRLGILFENKDFSGRNLTTASQWYEKSANLGNLFAMTNLGDLLRNKDFPGYNLESARQWYEKAAARGHVFAMNRLGLLLESPDYPQRNLVLARDWFRKAGAAGNKDGQRNLARSYFSSRNYVEALAAQERHVEMTEADELKADGKAGGQTTSALVGLSWYALHAREFSRALAGAERGHALTPSDLVIETNRAHALMFLGRLDEARELYRAYVDKRPNPSRTWQEEIRGDFQAFRRIGLDHPLMQEIEAEWSKA